MKGRIWTVPNQITLLRLGFLPIFLILISYEHYRWALAVLVVAGLSDGIDGLLARKLNQRSSLGAYLDPIADKLLLSSSFVILAFKKEIAWWLTIIVLSRDVLILIVAVVIILIWGYRPFPPSLLGKMTTFFQIVLVFTVVLGAAYPNALLAGIKQILIYLVAALATVSAFHYSVNIARNLSSPAHPPAKLGPAADRDSAKS
jgi:cardiolipin synthase (CMP-forming)